MSHPHPSPSKPSTTDAVASINDWASIDQFCALFPHIPEKTLRWQLTKRHTNGLDSHVRLIGKQRYISISGYARWLEHGFQG